MNKSSQKAINIFFLVIFIASNFQASNSSICSMETSKTDCSKSLKNYPLFDTPYKIHANYLPILSLRALAHAEIYKEKKPFKIERYFYVKDTSGAFKEPYAKLIGSGKVEGSGLIGRKISFEGKLNEFPLKYTNQMSFSLPKKAHMKVESTIDGISFLNLDIRSDGDAMTNDVKGTFFGSAVNYHTQHRDSKGTLAGYPYEIHTVGETKEVNKFTATTKGKIGTYTTTGSVSMTAPNKYLSTENYGPIMVKTFITIL